jgi:hypothetical protein
VKRLAEGEVGFHDLDSSVLGRRQESDGKSVESRLHQPPKQSSLFCPQCLSRRLYHGGFRYLTDGTPVQRWLCRDCNYRFSPKSGKRKPLQNNSNCQLNTTSTLRVNRQERSESRKRRATTLLAGGLTLVTSQTQQNAQREGTTQTTDKTARIVEFLWNLRQNGVKGNTLGSYSAILRKTSKKHRLNT